MRGNIDVNPIEKACTYCPYAGMCSFDVNAGDKYTEVPGYKLPEVISKLDEMYEDSKEKNKYAKLTPKQKEVIDARDQNILVSAAAGSGKLQFW